GYRSPSPPSPRECRPARASRTLRRRRPGSSRRYRRALHTVGPSALRSSRSRLPLARSMHSPRCDLSNIADNSAYISVYYTRTGGVRLLRDFGRLAPPNGNSPFRAEGAVRVRQARTVIVRRALQAHLQNGAYV